MSVLLSRLGTACLRTIGLDRCLPHIDVSDAFQNDHGGEQANEKAVRHGLLTIREKVLGRCVQSSHCCS
jgi:hypothetical protein